MNFFEQQEKTKRQSRRLVFVFILSVIAIVLLVDTVVALVITQAGLFSGGTNSLSVNGPINPFTADWISNNLGLLATSSLITTGFIGASSLYKTVRLSFGGSVVAKEMGGTQITADVSDPLRKRFYNVVEEMAIASGLPMPEVYVLEEEAAINAFAAGSQPSNAVVAVTRGTLEHLNRDELQGVVAHEFSHILNGDMRLNIRIMGILFGILIISLIGRMLMRGSRRSRIISSRGRNDGVSYIIFVGIALAAIGWLGLTIGRWVKASISRQREYLADASAVQFTRQTDGIKRALMKIGAFTQNPVMQRHDSEEVNHMLFSSGFKSFSNMFATHPPLKERLVALDPNFKESEISALAKSMEDNARRVAKQAEKELELEEKKRKSGFGGLSDAMGAGGLGDSLGSVLGGIGILLPGMLGNSVGNPAVQHVKYAEELRSLIPNTLLDAAHDRNDNVLHLVLALLLHPDKEERNQQLMILKQQMGSERTDEIEAYFNQVSKLGDQFRLPLLDLSFPALKRRPREQVEFLRSQVNKIITTDNKVEPFEYVLSRVLASHLTDVWTPYADAKKLSKSDEIESALRHMFSVVSLEGSHDNQINAEAYTAGIQYLVQHPNSKPLLKKITIGNIQQYQQPGSDWIVEMDEALLGFDALDLKVKRALIEALSVTIGFDQHVSQTESEMLRAICSTFHCPLPPLLKSKE